MTLSITKPAMDYMPSFIEALGEGSFTHMALGGFGVATAEEVKQDPVSYLERLTSSAPRPVKTPDGREFFFNDHEIYWIVDDARFLGGMSLRYDRDCELINAYCGHVGMGLRASVLNKGYGIKAVQQAWAEGMNRAREKGLDCFLASCNPDNRASQRLIQHFGGQLTSTADPFGYGPNELYSIHLNALKEKTCH